MCIIVAKPANTPMISDKILENCWESNSDGAGFMYAKDNRVYIQKGFMTLKSFKNALDRLGSVYSLDELPIVLHFRISTQGGVNPQNTHPFPITNDVHQLTGSKTSSPIGGMAHNGVIPQYSFYGSKTAHAYSDTLLFVKEAVSQMVHTPKDLENKTILTDLENIAKSKLAFLSPDGNIHLLGDFNMDKGVAYSNYTWYGWFNYGSWKYKGKNSKTKSYWYGSNPAWYDYEYDYDDYGDPFLASYYKDLDENCKDYREKKEPVDDESLKAEFSIRVWPCDPDLNCYYDMERNEYLETMPGDYYDSWGHLWYINRYGLLVPTLDSVFDYNLRPVSKFGKDCINIPVHPGYESYINDYDGSQYTA